MSEPTSAPITLYAARRSLQVIAFEPAAVNYFVLAKNIELNGLDETVTGLNIALDEHTGLGTLLMPATRMGSSSHTYRGGTQETGAWSAPSGASVTHRQAVLAYTIDDFIEAYQPAFPTHIKIDVDGNEALVLRGATRTLQDPRLESLVIEVRGDTYDDVARLLAAGGLTSARYLRRKQSTNGGDVLFTRDGH